MAYSEANEKARNHHNSSSLGGRPQCFLSRRPTFFSFVNKPGEADDSLSSVIVGRFLRAWSSFAIGGLFDDRVFVPVVSVSRSRFRLPKSLLFAFRSSFRGRDGEQTARCFRIRRPASCRDNNDSCQSPVMILTARCMSLWCDMLDVRVLCVEASFRFFFSPLTFRRFQPQEVAGRKDRRLSVRAGVLVCFWPVQFYIAHAVEILIEVPFCLSVYLFFRCYRISFLSFEFKIPRARRGSTSRSKGSDTPPKEQTYRNRHARVESTDWASVGVIWYSTVPYWWSFGNQYDYQVFVMYI